MSSGERQLTSSYVSMDREAELAGSEEPLMPKRNGKGICVCIERVEIGHLSSSEDIHVL